MKVNSYILLTLKGYKYKRFFQEMEKKKQIEFLIAGMAVILLLTLIILLLYSSSETPQSSNNLKFYEKTSDYIVRDGFSYKQETSRDISIQDGSYSETISKVDSITTPYGVYLQNQFYLQKNLVSSNLKVIIN